MKIFLTKKGVPKVATNSHVHIHGRLSEQFSKSQAAFTPSFRVTGGYRKAGTSFLKIVTGRVFTVSKGIHGSKQKLYSGL